MTMTSSTHLPATLPGIRHTGDGKIVAFCADLTCRPAYDGPTCDVIDIPRQELALAARCWTCGDYLTLSIRRDDIEMVIGVYDATVRATHSEREVAEFEDDATCWQIIEVARNMNLLGRRWDTTARARLLTKINHGTEMDDAEFAAVWSAALEYVARLREELAGLPVPPPITMHGLLAALSRAAATMGYGSDRRTGG